MEWIREAAEKCLLVETIACFPKRPNKEEHKHYTSDDWKLSKCLVAIRQMRIQALALEDGEQITQQTINRTKRRVVKTEGKGANLVTGKQYASIWKAAKKGEINKLVSECTEVIQTLDSHLSKKMRYERAKQMSTNLKRRTNRFENKDKTMLKLVINSIMQKHQSQQHIISAESEGEMKYGDKDVAVAITAFFETWMGSKVGVEQRCPPPERAEKKRGTTC